MKIKNPDTIETKALPFLLKIWRLKCLFCFLAIFSLTACQWENSSTVRPSILILAVDGLGGNESLCPEDANSSELYGIAALCRESIRFTHAFTTSPLSVPALGSILTGLYPLENNLHDNSQFLSARATTLAEEAYDLGYSTAFFSGGAPVLRKTGLHQGFEMFYDFFQPRLNQFQESSKDVMERFLLWQSKIKTNTFSFIYIPYPYRTGHFLESTLKENPKDPSREFKDTLDDSLDDSLSLLMQTLKKQKKWDQTFLALAGLNGRMTRENSAFPLPMNLHSENTQITLLIKPHRLPKGDEGSHWTEDQPVSLADLGSSIFELLRKKPVPFSHSEDSFNLKKISLLPFLKKPGKSTDNNRLIPTESAWGKWHFQGPIYFSFRFDRWLMFLETPPRYYNTLTDKLEISPWINPQSEAVVKTFHELTYSIFRDPRAQPIKRNKEMMTLYQILQPDFWENPTLKEFRAQKMIQILKNKTLDPFYEALLGSFFIENELWAELEELGQKIKQPDWVILAKRQMASKNGSLPPSSSSLMFSNPCLNFVLSKTKPSENQLKNCQDPLLLSLLRWRQKENRNDLLSFYYFYLDKKIIQANISAGLIWDIPLQKQNSIEAFELALSLPELQVEKNKIQKAISLLK